MLRRTVTTLRGVLDRDHNAALNILEKALGCTVGHTETGGLAP